MKDRLFKLSILLLLCAAAAVHAFDGLRVSANTNWPPAAFTGAGNPAAAQMQVGCDDDDFEFRGVIEALPSTSGFIGDWTVSGRTVRVSASTEIKRKDGQIAVGAKAEVEGCLQTDGSVVAKKIEVESDDDDDDFEFTGAIEVLPDTMGRIGDWTVSGVVVHVTATTLIKQEGAMIAVGVRVEVEGTKRADGSVDANKIEVKSDMGGPGMVVFMGTVESLPSTTGRIGEWSVGGRKVNVTASTTIPDNVGVGFFVRVRGTRGQDGAINAIDIQIQNGGGGRGAFVEFYGTVEMLPGTTGQIGMWTVSGRMVNVTANTRIITKGSTIAVGSVVEVRGAPQTGGSINAVMIKLKNRSGQFEFKGTIESLPTTADLVGDWVVSGRTVRVSAATEIERKYGMVMVGASVKVEGALQSDGSVNATEIQVKQGQGGGAYMNYNPVMTVSAASYRDDNAPGSIVSAFGNSMSSRTASATTLPLPLTLGDVAVMVDGKQARLFFVSPGQLNYQLPSNLASGSANVVVTNKGQMVAQGAIEVSNVALSLFTANASGSGAPAGLLLRVKANGQQALEPLARFDSASRQFVPAPIARQTGEQLFLILFGTGLQLAGNTDGNASNGVAENVQVTIGGANAQVIFAGKAPGFAGLEQLNVRIPDNAPANPATQVLVQARDRLNNLKQANPVTIALQ
jgi:uncharacterized protein (TIGR03437 family)